MAHPVPSAKTMYDKIWDAHVVSLLEDECALMYIDRHFVHEVSSPQAFESLRLSRRRVRRPGACLAVPDHNVPTKGRDQPVSEPHAARQIDLLRQNAAEFGISIFDLGDRRQGIVHVIGPEQGLTQPGMTIVCGDSHTSTHGAFGALAFGIGTSQVEQVLATQTLVIHKARNMQINVEGKLGAGVTPKDLILGIIGMIGAAGGNGHVIEFAGRAIEALSMEGRMTLCNMTTEAGARAGLVAPDEKTFAYLKGRPFAPDASQWDKATAYWSTLGSDTDAVFHKQATIDGAAIAPQVTWGTSPEDVVPVSGRVPNPRDESDPARRAAMRTSLDYMALQPGQKMSEIAVDQVFIGSCTNSRIEDLLEVARIVRGKKVAASITRAIIVPGSGLVKAEAEANGLDRIFTEAGFEWREPGCSMCLGMNEDRAAPGERVASTSNRNFQGRQGPGVKTHLMSPAVAAATAICGRISDARDLDRG